MPGGLRLKRVRLCCFPKVPLTTVSYPVQLYHYKKTPEDVGISKTVRIPVTDDKIAEILGGEDD